MFAIIDLETTGLSPAQDRIIEIAILIFDGETVVDRFVSLVNPQRRIPGKIESMTHISNEALQQAPPFFRIARKVVEMTENCIIVAHNVRFDYAFLRREFARLGYTYMRRQLCTARLSRQQFPQLTSHRLAAVCRFLNIDLSGHHRAEADARAALALFCRLSENAPQISNPLSENQESRNTILPAGLDREYIDNIPDATGVYYFYDSDEKLLYVGKSNNIRSRVMGHFSGDMASGKERALKDRVTEIQWDITGSELVALLHESDLIKRLRPPYNRSQKRIRYRYGIYSSVNPRGYIEFQIRKLQGPQLPIVSFSSKVEIAAFMDRMIVRHELCQKLCHLHRVRGACFHYHIKLCRGACIGAETPEEYNRRARQSIRQFNYAHANFFIIGDGRHNAEKSAVCIEQGVYRGFGYFPSRVAENEIERIREAIEPRPDNQDIRRIINRHLNKMPDAAVLVFTPPADDRWAE